MRKKWQKPYAFFPLTKGFIALYGYSVIFKSLSPLGDSKLCFRLTKTGRFNGEYADKPSQPLPPELVCL